MAAIIKGKNPLFGGKEACSKVCTDHHLKSYRPKLGRLLGRLVDTTEFEVAKALLFASGETEAEAVNLGKVAKQVNGQRVTILVCGL